MTRVSKKDRLKRCPRKPHYGSVKTGPLKDNLPKGFKEHANVLSALMSFERLAAGKMVKIKKSRGFLKRPLCGERSYNQ